MDVILEEIDKALKKKGLSPAAASKLAAGHFSLIKNMKSSKAGGKRYSVETLEKLAEVLDLELYFGPRRDLGASPPTLDIDGDEFAAIPRLEVEASAGAGAFNDQAEVVGKLAFRRDWLRKMGVAAKDAMLITVTGQSMEPTLAPGDLVLVDAARTQIADGKVFALNDIDGSIRIKRLFRPSPEMLVLQSDNRHPDFAPELRRGTDLNRLKVLGRIVWSGHNWD